MYRYHLPKIYFFIATIVVFIVFIVAINQTQSSFYANELQKNSISETVRIEGVEYKVINGDIEFDSTAETYTEIDNEQIFRLAYAKTLARRSPLLGINGVDPSALRDAISELALVQNNLAIAQETQEKYNLVTTLYPINFLNAVAFVEESRQTFLMSGSEIDRKAYSKAIKDATLRGLEDILAFKDSLTFIIGEGNFKILELGGTTTNETLLKSTELIEVRMKEVSQAIYEYEECLGGDTSLCKKDSLKIDFQTYYSDTKVTKEEQQIPHLKNEIIDIFSEVINDFEKRTVIKVSSSTCLSSISGPYYFSMNPGDKNVSSLFEYVGDIFFRITGDFTGETITYLKDVHNISFLKFSPTTFYTCPDILEDLGVLKALERVILLTEKFPIVLHLKCNEEFEDNLFYECELLHYLSEIQNILKEDSSLLSSEILREVEVIHSMFVERSAGLDDLVTSIATIDAKNLEFYLSGTPFDISAEILFTARSAFPSLYLTHNPSAGETLFTFREENSNDTSLYFSKIKRYSEIRTLVNQGKILSDIQNFYRYERSSN